MSLAGIAIAIGDVSDMGIIMTENIYRRLAAEPERPYAEVVYEASCEVGGAIVRAESNTVISFIPVFALTGPEGKMFQPLAYTKTFAFAASVILAITVVPVLSYYLLKPVVWSKRRSLLVGCVAGLLTILTLRFAVAWGLGLSGLWTGWPTAMGTGLLVTALVYRMARERLQPLEENTVSRAIFVVYKPVLRWVLTHKGTFLMLPAVVVLIGVTVWLGFGRMATPLTKSFNAFAKSLRLRAFR